MRCAPHRAYFLLFLHLLVDNYLYESILSRFFDIPVNIAFQMIGGHILKTPVFGFGGGFMLLGLLLLGFPRFLRSLLGGNAGGLCPLYNPAFFTLDPAKQRNLLVPYAWAEFYSLLDQTPPLRDLAVAGFIQTDTQIQFLLNLSKVEATASTDRLDYNFADQQNFNIEVEELAMFTHERFGHIPGCTVARTNERNFLGDE